MNRSGNTFKPFAWLMAALLAAVVAGCGGGGDGAAPAAAPAHAASHVCSGASCVALGAAGSYVILAQSGVSTVPTSAVTGSVGVSPAVTTSITGFDPLTLDPSGKFSTSSQVTGKLFAADNTDPTGPNLVTAVADAGTAYNDASTRTPTFPANPTAGVIPAAGSPPVVPGVYNWTGNVAMTDVTLEGGANDVWIFQIAGNLTQAANTTVTLHGAQAKNVFWAVAGNVTLATGAHIEGVVLSQTGIGLQTGASAKGRLIAGTAVTLDGSTVIQP